MERKFKSHMVDVRGLSRKEAKEKRKSTKPSSFTAQMVYIMIPVLGYLLIKSAKTQTQT